jgi:hypothetical protein
MAIDPWGKQFTIFPSVGCDHQITLAWEGVKTSYEDEDEVPFDMDVVECVGLFVKAKIARLVDHDLAEHGSYMAEYIRRRALLYADSQERKRLALLADSPNQANKCANSLSTCCRDGTAGNCFNPNNPTEGTTDFCAFGDSGDPDTIGNTSAVSILVKSLEPDFVMHMGDCNYPNGDPVTIQANLLKYYSLFIPNQFYLSFGNHDVETDNGAALQILLALQASLNAGKRYYDFIPSNRQNTGTCHVFVLDTEGDPVEQAAWLQPMLAGSAGLWNIVVLHKSPYTSDIDHAPGDVNWRLPFKDWGAHVVISAHGHSYERLLVDGMQYVVCGLGGAPKRGFTAPPTTGSQFRYNTFYGSLYVSSKLSRLQISFFDTRGEVVDSIAFDSCPLPGGGGGSPVPVPVPNPGTWCQLRGEPAPEGVVTSEVGCWYRRKDDSNYEFWYHESNGGTPFGWILVEKLS